MPLPLPSYFDDFLKEIRPTAQRASMAKGHRILRERLQADEHLAPGIVGMFLQGSYKRFTAVRPKDGNRADVDLIVVTRMKESELTPQQAMKCFVPFLEEHYQGKYRPQGRSFGIELSYVEMDLVITAAPSEAEAGMYQKLAEEEDPSLDEDAEATRVAKSDAKEEALWKVNPLRIPNREVGKWQDTDPLEQISWTRAKNGRTSGHYGNVVKALKWWRLTHADELPEQPRGYPLEHVVGDCCPDGITSVAEGVVRTFEEISRRYAAHASEQRTPVLHDRGVNQNVMARVGGEDFAAFHSAVAEAAKKARRAFEAPDAATAAPIWRELLGGEFPKAPDNPGGGGPSSDGFSRNSGPSTVPVTPRFAHD